MSLRPIPMVLGLLAVSLFSACGLNAGGATDRPVVSLASPPPPIVGGTLALRGGIAVVADADRDAIHVVDLDSRRRLARHQLPLGAEPGRVVFGPGGTAHVVLRGAGAVASVSDAGLLQTPVCAHPRGLDIDDAGVRWLACWNGEVWRLAQERTEVVARLEPGLRDLVVLGERLLVSHFRSARVHVLSLEGRRLRTLRPDDADVVGLPYRANSAVRLRRRDGRAWLLFQRSRVGAEPVPTALYAGTVRGPCGESSVQTVVSEVTPEGVGPGAVLANGSLAVDVDVDRVGATALALAGEIDGWQEQRFRRVRHVAARGGCLEDARATSFEGQAVAVAFREDDRLVAFSREPAALLIDGAMVDLFEPSRRDTGHDLFHVRREGVSCASCHAEGGEDGHLWTLGDASARRTSSLRGGVSSTAPFHADGDVSDLREVLRRQFPEEANVYLDEAHVGALANWLDGLPSRSRPSADSPGAQLFSDLGCVSCHATTRGSVTGLVLLAGQPRAVPTLVELHDRAPYFADGCAQDLGGVFTEACDRGSEHTRVGSLSVSERDALLAYLRSR